MGTGKFQSHAGSIYLGNGSSNNYDAGRPSFQSHAGSIYLGNYVWLCDSMGPSCFNPTLVRSTSATSLAPGGPGSEQCFNPTLVRSTSATRVAGAITFSTYWFQSHAGSIYLGNFRNLPRKGAK